jgi:microcystin-dependent protein
LGAGGGDERFFAHGHTLTDPGHAHGISDPGHVHAVPTNDSQGGSGSWPFFGGARDGAPSVNTLATATATTGIAIATAATGISIATSGSGTAQNVQPSLVVNHVIKT